MINPFFSGVSAIAVIYSLSACTSRAPSSTSQPTPESSPMSAEEIVREKLSMKRSSSMSPEDAIAKETLSKMIDEQFSAYGAQKKFSATGNDSKSGVPPGDMIYNYQIVRVTPTNVYMTATPKRPKLRSLSAQVFVIPEVNSAKADKQNFIAGLVCITETPSQSAPAASADAPSQSAPAASADAPSQSASAASADGTVTLPPCPSGSFSVWSSIHSSVK